MEYIDSSKDSSFFFRVAPNKISIGSGGVGSMEHFTLSFGLGSKILDVHKTKEGGDVRQEEKHAGQYYLRHFTIGRIFVHIKKVVPKFEKSLVRRQVPMSVLKRLNLTLMRVGDVRVEELVKIDKNGTRIKLAKRIRKDLVDDLFGCTCQVRSVQAVEVFVAFREKRGGLEPYGLVLAFPQKSIPKRVILFNFERMKPFWKSHLNEVLKIIEREMTTEKQQLLERDLKFFLQNNKTKSLA